jgi:GDPmannose 4,6-dehydratase
MRDNMKKRAFITGITGQDGSYLAEYLLEKGYDVWGLMRRTSLDPLMRLGSLAKDRKIKLLYGNMRDIGSLERALSEARPDEIYNLAAQSQVWISFKCPEETMEINYHGLGRLIHEAVKINPKVRIYQASTSEMYGTTKPPQNETSPFRPVSPYGEAKLLAHEDFVKGYRERHGLFICSGILFNHESPRRGENFVTRKITISLSKIKLGLQDTFSLGNLDAKRDWGFAGDYVRAMHLMLQQKKPKDYVIATGESHSVRDFVEAACRALDMPLIWKGSGLKERGISNGKTILVIDKEFYRPSEVDNLRGDSSRAKRELGWTPSVTFNGLVEVMVRADYETQKKLL